MNFRKWGLCEFWVILSMHMLAVVQVLAQADVRSLGGEPSGTGLVVNPTSETIPNSLFDSASLFDHSSGKTQTWSVTDNEVVGRGFPILENGRWREFQAGRDELSWRLRRITRREHLLGPPNAPRFVIWDEDYQDSRDRGWGAESNFQQGRSFAGFSWRSASNDRLQMELGYLNQTWDEPGPDDRRFHFFSLNFYY